MRTDSTPDRYDSARQRTLIVLANGGSVQIQVEGDTDQWITTDTVFKDGAYPITIPAGRVRFVPAGGATYEVR